MQRRIIGLRHRKAYLKVDQLTRNFHTSKDQLTQIAHRHPKQYFLDDENRQHKEENSGIAGAVGNIGPSTPCRSRFLPVTENFAVRRSDKGRQTPIFDKNQHRRLNRRHQVSSLHCRNHLENHFGKIQQEIQHKIPRQDQGQKIANSFGTKLNVCSWIWVVA